MDIQGESDRQRHTIPNQKKRVMEKNKSLNIATMPAAAESHSYTGSILPDQAQINLFHSKEFTGQTGNAVTDTAWTFSHPPPSPFSAENWLVIYRKTVLCAAS